GARVRLLTGIDADGLFLNPLDVTAADEGVTDPGGSLSLSCAGGRAAVQVVPQAHAPATATANVPVEGAAVEVRVAPGRTLEVHVTGPRGERVAGATVSCRAQPLYARTATTDEAGAARFD